MLDSTVFGVFLYAFLTAVATGFGALPFLFMQDMPRRWLGISNAIAAGLMGAASWGLIYEGLNYGMPRTVVGILAGLVFIVGTRKLLGGGMRQAGVIAAPGLLALENVDRLAEDGWLGILITPWFMNAVLLPADPAAFGHLGDGDKTDEALPAGVYEFITGTLDPAGTLKSCSLFSPVFEFADQATARLTAEHALAALMDGDTARSGAGADGDALPWSGQPLPAAPQPRDTPAEVSRRRLLRGSLGDGP